MRRIAILAGLFACGGKSPAPSPPPVAPAVAATACAPPLSDTAPATGEAWRASVPGPALLEVAGDLIVARHHGGTVSLDASTGTRCVVLVDGSRRAIEGRSAVAHGMLVGSSKLAVAAVDLRTGQPRWTHPLVGKGDEYALRDELEVASTNTAIIVAFHVQHRLKDSFRFEELVVALDPATGRELWRMTAVDHPPGVPMHIDRSVRIAGAGERVLVRMPGKLSALDGATGKLQWSTTWTPAPLTIGPPTPAKLGPLAATDGDWVAVAFPNHVRLLDARTGTRAREVSVSGVATELVVRDGIVFAALERAPGSATAVAIEAATGRTSWSYAAAYAVRRLRVDDELVYVLDGNGRVWGLERATGSPRFGFGAGNFEFVVANKRVIVPQAAGLAAFEPQPGAPPPLEAFARWEYEDTAVGCRARALSWVDGNDRVVWKRALPARFRAHTCDPEYRRHPRAHSPGLGVIDLGTAFLVGDGTGVLALRKRDGTILLDVEAPSADLARSVYFDSGAFELQGVGLANCSGSAPRAIVFARCGERLVFFNRTTALVIALDKLHVEATGRFTGGATEQGIETRASIQLGSFTLDLTGITHHI